MPTPSLWVKFTMWFRQHRSLPDKSDHHALATKRVVKNIEHVKARIDALDAQTDWMRRS